MIFLSAVDKEKLNGCEEGLDIIYSMHQVTIGKRRVKLEDAYQSSE